MPRIAAAFINCMRLIPNQEAGANARLTLFVALELQHCMPAMAFQTAARGESAVSEIAYRQGLSLVFLKCHALPRLQ